MAKHIPKAGRVPGEVQQFITSPRKLLYHFFSLNKQGILCYFLPRFSPLHKTGRNAAVCRDSRFWNLKSKWWLLSTSKSKPFLRWHLRMCVGKNAFLSSVSCCESEQKAPAGLALMLGVCQERAALAAGCLQVAREPTVACHWATCCSASTHHLLYLVLQAHLLYKDDLGRLSNVSFTYEISFFPSRIMKNGWSSEIIFIIGLFFTAAE